MASRFENEIGFAHGARENIGVLLSNLGTPDLPTPRAVRRYLRQFLSDPAVIEAPAWRWQPILRAFVLPFRPRRVAALYRSIWTPVGSPLLAISRRQKSALEAALNPAATKDDAAVKVALGMRYGEPSLARALAALRAQNCRRLVVLPLYPQYANSTTGTVFTEIARALAKRRYKPHLRFVASYCDEPGYIDALARSITNHQSERGKPDLLLFSFHGTPRAMLEGGDPYHCLCQKTARQAAAAAGLADNEWEVAFQSRFGRAEWLRPYADETIAALPRRGIKKLQVICPAFAADCLETLEEIARENRNLFLRAGGESFSYIPALNDAPAHIDFLRALVERQIADWRAHLARENRDAARAAQKLAARKLGAAA